MLADAIEAQTVGGVLRNPLVDSLLLIERSTLNGDDVWFGDDFHVYLALYASGPRGRLRLVAADPINETTLDPAKATKAELQAEREKRSPFVRASWDLELLHMKDRLFNGSGTTSPSSSRMR